MATTTYCEFTLVYHPGGPIGYMSETDHEAGWYAKYRVPDYDHGGLLGPWGLTAEAYPSEEAARNAILAWYPDGEEIA